MARILFVLAFLVALPTTLAAEVGQGHYTGTLGFGATGFDGSGALLLCELKPLMPEAGCFGGDAVAAPSGAPYNRAEVTTIDTVSGPNVHHWVCFRSLEDDPGTPCTPGVHAIQEGCGVALEPDAGELGKVSNLAVVTVRTLHADTSTNEICLGFQGGITVVFDD